MPYALNRVRRTDRPVASKGNTTMATKYVARLNGEIIGKRTSKDRTYTHAIICARPAVGNYYHGKNSKFEAAHITNWCGRLDLAQKEASRWSKMYEVVEIVPAEVA